jgi:hypothetical protein
MRISTVEFFSKRGKRFVRAYAIGRNSHKVPMPPKEFTDSKQVEDYLAKIEAAHTIHDAVTEVRRV